MVICVTDAQAFHKSHGREFLPFHLFRRVGAACDAAATAAYNYFNNNNIIIARDCRESTITLIK